MDIRLLDKNDTEQAKALWKSAFGDSDEFIDTYFDNKILPGNSIGIFDSGLKSVVHMIPYKIRLQGRSFQSAYIAGAATAQDSRKLGLMKLLLNESLMLMRSRGIFMTHLYPFLHSFYEQFGWATYSYVEKVVVTEGRKAKNVEQTKDINILHSLYHNMIRSCDGYVIRADREWKWRTDELYADGGKTYVLYEDGQPVCYMMCFEDNGSVEILETVYKHPRYARRLAEHLAAVAGSVEYYLMSQDQNNAAHGMARIVDAQRVLEEFGATKLLEKLAVHDDFAKWNNLGSGSTSLDIGELTRAVHMGFKRALGPEGIQYAEMLNMDINERFTCIFEEY